MKPGMPSEREIMRHDVRMIRKLLSRSVDGVLTAPAWPFYAIVVVCLLLWGLTA